VRVAHADSGVTLSRLVAAFNTPFTSGGYAIGASVGIALCPRDGAGAEAPLACADEVMYAAKLRDPAGAER